MKAAVVVRADPTSCLPFLRLLYADQRHILLSHQLQSCESHPLNARHASTASDAVTDHLVQRMRKSFNGFMFSPPKPHISSLSHLLDADWELPAPEELKQPLRKSPGDEAAYP